jgi:hypothetical protein
MRDISRRSSWLVRSILEVHTQRMEEGPSK